MCAAVMAQSVSGARGMYRLAVLRSTGTVGFDVFEDLLLNGHVPLSQQLSRPDCVSEYVYHVPLSSVCNTNIHAVASARAVNLYHHKVAQQGYFLKSRVSDLTITNFNHNMRVANRIICALGPTNVTFDLLYDADTPSIEDYFLSSCEFLASISFPALPRVEYVPPFFLYGCRGLKDNLQLPELVNLTEISNGFLAGCSQLESIDLAPISRVQFIQDAFFESCVSLKVINLTALTQLVRIGRGFLDGCLTLPSVDLSSMGTVLSTNRHFLAHCPAITSITVSKELQPVVWRKCYENHKALMFAKCGEEYDYRDSDDDDGQEQAIEGW